MLDLPLQLNKGLRHVDLPDGIDPRTVDIFVGKIIEQIPKIIHAQLLTQQFGFFGPYALKIFNFLINQPVHDSSAFRKYRKSLFKL
jgi:hypothetical protein